MGHPTIKPFYGFRFKGQVLNKTPVMAIKKKSKNARKQTHIKTKSWNIKTWIAELGVFMHKFAIENDPKP